MSYRERLVAPWGWWTAALVVVGFAAATVHSGAGGGRAVVPYVVGAAVLAGGMGFLSRHVVRVEDGVLHVPGARAPLSAFGPAEPLDAGQLRQWRGQRASRDAFVSLRPWSRSAVRLPVVDPDDDTPYWLVATRRPADLAASLGAQSFSGS